MKRFRLKMLVAITVGAFTTFTMLLYITTETARCNSTDGAFCFYVYNDESRVSKNFTYQLRRRKDGEEPPKPETDWFRQFQLLTKSKVADAAVRSATTDDVFAIPRPGSRDSFRTRRNIYVSGQASKMNYATSAIAGNATTRAPPPGNPPVKYVATSSSEKSTNSNDKYSNWNDFRATTKWMSLLGSNKFNVSWATDDSYKYYVERQRTLHVGCKRHFNQSHVLQVKRLKLDHILIDENRKILFCYVPKVACTNWKRIFMLLTGKAENISAVKSMPSYKVHEKNLFTSLRNYSQEEVNRIIRDYTKFIFVRNPFERLLSAYRNKLEQHYDSSKYFQARFGKYIIKKFRKNPSNNSLSKGDDVTFSEFVDYLLSSDASSYNEHWQTVTNLCHPCLVNYDLIGKYETLIRDSNFVLRYLNLNFSFPELGKPSQTASNLKNYFKTIGKDVIYKLYKIYQMDFKLFGYNLHNTLDWSDKFAN